MHRIATIIGLGLVIVSCVATQAGPPELSFLVVNGAENVQEHQAYDGGRLQVNYSVVIKYPNLAIGEPQW